MTYPIGNIPDAQLVSATHGAMKKKLEGMTLANGTTTPTNVPVTFSLPEEWLDNRQSPSVNINSIRTLFDPSRYTTAKIRTFTDDTKSEVQEQAYMIPVNYFYEIRFIVSYGQHMMSLNEQILRRFPYMGFHSYVEVPYGNETIMCPFELIDEKQIFARYGETEDNREFQRLFRYKLQGWVDTYDVKTYKTILDIDIKTQFE